jgi:hypothetical protein
MYCLFDASVIVPYSSPTTHENKNVHTFAVNIIESVRSGASNHFLYIPNFCIAEVFSTFSKHALFSNFFNGAAVGARTKRADPKARPRHLNRLRLNRSP